MRSNLAAQGLHLNTFFTDQSWFIKVHLQRVHDPLNSGDEAPSGQQRNLDKHVVNSNRDTMSLIIMPQYGTDTTAGEAPPFSATLPIFELLRSTADSLSTGALLLRITLQKFRYAVSGSP